LTLEISEGDLLIRDAETEERLLTAADASDRRAEVSEQRALVLEERADASEQLAEIAQQQARAAIENAAKLAERNRALEAELERLRQERS
jgi:hypothetical protein